MGALDHENAIGQSHATLYLDGPGGCSDDDDHLVTIDVLNLDHNVFG